MASGGSAPLYRFYFHARPATCSLLQQQQPILMEVLVDKTAGNAGITVKSADAVVLEPFADVFRGCLANLTLYGVHSLVGSLWTQISEWLEYVKWRKIHLQGCDQWRASCTESHCEPERPVT